MKKLLMLAGLLFGGSLFAQKISGTVYDDKKAPVADANVGWLGTNA